MIETRIWPAEQTIQYVTLMLYYNIKNNQEDDRRKREKQLQQHFLQKSTADNRNLGELNRKSNRQEKINTEKTSEGESDKVKKRISEEMAGRNKFVEQ